MKNFRVAIQRSSWNESLGIAIFEERDGKTFMWKPVKFEIMEIYEHEQIEKPTIELPSSIAVPFLKAMADAISEHGVKTDSDEKLAGTLEATRGWLADMRRLVFKKENS